MDKFDSLNYPNFQPNEIDLLFNQAQDMLVKDRYGITNLKRQSFEETQKRTEDLKNIVRNAIIVPTPNAPDNINTEAVFVTLPTDHWFIIQERVDLTYLDCKNVDVNKSVEVRPIGHNEFDKIIIDPFKKPSKYKVLRLMENGRVELIPAPGIVINNYKLRYLKEPVRVNITTGVTFELSNHLHSEIIDTAVKIALEGTEAKRNQTFNEINSIKE